MIFHYASPPCCSRLFHQFSLHPLFTRAYTSIWSTLANKYHLGGTTPRVGIRGEYNLIGKKLTRDVSIKEQSKGRMLARAEQCVISQRRTVCRARLRHVAVRYRFYNQGKGSEPHALVSPPAKPSLTPCKLTSIPDVTILKYLVAHKNF